MFLRINSLLTAAEVARLRELAGTLKFVHGRISNPASTAKDNLQADYSDPGYAESSKIVADAFARSREFNEYALPKRIAPPLMCRYEPGMKYGVHADAGHIPLPDGPLRSDISSTVFINDPASYQGGELTIHLGSSTTQIKYNPGDAIIYPSTTLHEVAPVRSGQRLVSITFIQSYVPEELRRDALYELAEVYALESAKMDWASRVRLSAVRENLLRMWSTL